MIRRAFPKEFMFISDDRFILSTHDAEGLWLVRLAPDWFEMLAQRRLQPPTLLDRVFESSPWPKSITVEIAPSSEAADRSGQLSHAPFPLSLQLSVSRQFFQCHLLIFCAVLLLLSPQAR